MNRRKLTRHDLGRVWNVSTRTLAEYEKFGLPVERAGQRVVYDAVTAERWLATFRWRRSRTPRNQRVGWVPPMTERQRAAVDAREARERMAVSARFHEAQRERLARLREELARNRALLEGLGLRSDGQQDAPVTLRSLPRRGGGSGTPRPLAAPGPAIPLSGRCGNEPKTVSRAGGTAAEASPSPDVAVGTTIGERADTGPAPTRWIVRDRAGDVLGQVAATRCAWARSLARRRFGRGARTVQPAAEDEAPPRSAGCSGPVTRAADRQLGR
ncbi:MAG: hypothetical protein FJ206_13150 [Gemmatimonadetes bacterium]|nr:hypothetical protein [Gemmatimonadota bacterium]